MGLNADNIKKLLVIIVLYLEMCSLNGLICYKIFFLILVLPRQSFLCVGLTVLEFPLKTKLASNSFLPVSSTDIKGMCYHVQPYGTFLIILFLLICVCVYSHVYAGAI